LVLGLQLQQQQSAEQQPTWRQYWQQVVDLDRMIDTIVSDNTAVTQS
jgi:hypothetical protein